MSKLVKFFSVMLAVMLIVVAFTPSALAVTYAPKAWADWPQQERYEYDTRYTYAIQRFLVDRYNKSNVIAIDGKFGPTTQAWVRLFQSDRGLQVDGIVGTNTWSNMYKLQTASGSYRTVIRDVAYGGSTSDNHYVYVYSNSKWYVYTTMWTEIYN